MSHQIIKPRIIWHSSGMLGNGALLPNARIIKILRNYNGSGPQAFGGARSWPVVELCCGFEANQDSEAEAFALALTEFCREYMNENGLIGAEQPRDIAELNRRAAKGLGITAS